jgi:predicted enzyme related to lactoylglutathione lyase
MSYLGKKHGTFSFAQLKTKDANLAVRSYGTLFNGWLLQVVPVPTAPEGGKMDTTMIVVTKKHKFAPYFAGIYAMPKVDQMPAQFNKLPEAAKKHMMTEHWSSVVNVRCAKTATAYVKNSGGTVILEPMDVPGIGTMAKYADPNGVFFTVIEYFCNKSMSCDKSKENCDMPKGADCTPKKGECDAMQEKYDMQNSCFYGCLCHCHDHCHNHVHGDCCPEGDHDMDELMSWFEYVADDEDSLKKAKLFYSGLFGWIIHWGVADGAKTAMAKHVGDKYPLAYLYVKDAAHSAKGWMPSAFVPCVKEYADKAKSLGMEVVYLDANACARAVIKDKAGALFGLRSYK